MYGGHVLSVARALSLNGPGNVLHIAAINGGTHADPVFAATPIYAWSEFLDKAEVAGHPDLGALRLAWSRPRIGPAAIPVPGWRRHGSARGVLDFDYWGLVPR